MCLSCPRCHAHTAPRRLATHPQAGLYTSASPYTCAGYAASCGFEWIDAQQWAKWKVDFMKEDAVRTQHGCIHASNYLE
eukprot:SAG11_NODE_7829_length_1091_cov_1.324597_1_plen_78_part_10